MFRSRTIAVLTTAALACSAVTALTATSAAALPATTTPIKHLVVIFQENVSFDHYFGTYPNAAGGSGQAFTAAGGTPSVDGLQGSLLSANPNGVNPRRLNPANVADLITCDQDHTYTNEQKAFDGGAMDKFPQTVGNG
ncbi:MAG TPA: alkaline phosphatase family protein, partial [Acidimicrobiales bacterium]|nr:alkaline phosphatase family protein [Acidimicrobiales bacterium]